MPRAIAVSLVSESSGKTPRVASPNISFPALTIGTKSRLDKSNALA